VLFLLLESWDVLCYYLFLYLILCVCFRFWFDDLLSWIGIQDVIGEITKFSYLFMYFSNCNDLDFSTYTIKHIFIWNLPFNGYVYNGIQIIGLGSWLSHGTCKIIGFALALVFCELGNSIYCVVIPNLSNFIWFAESIFMKYHIYYSKVYNCVYTYWSLFMVLVILWWIRSRQGAHSLLKLIGSAVLTLSTEIHPSIFCGSWWHPSIYWLELMKRTWHIVEIIKEVKLLTCWQGFTS
jgi:hypothetical protein